MSVLYGDTVYTPPTSIPIPRMPQFYLNIWLKMRSPCHYIKVYVHVCRPIYVCNLCMYNAGMCMHVCMCVNVTIYVCMYVCILCVSLRVCRCMRLYRPNESPLMTINIDEGICYLQ